MNKKIMKDDDRGNYDIDGVSSDGDRVYLAGDSTSSSSPVSQSRKKEAQNKPTKYKKIKERK